MSAVSSWTRSTVAAARLTWRSDMIVLLLGLVLTTAITAGIFVARDALHRAEASSLETAVDGATDDAVRLRIAVSDRFTPSGAANPLVVPERVVGDASAAIDPLVTGLFEQPRLVIDSPTLNVLSVDGAEPASPTRLVMRLQTGLTDHAEVTEGDVPQPTTDQVDGRRVVEVAIASETATDLGWPVGTELVVDPSVDDPLFREFGEVPDPFVVRVSGIARLDDAADVFWFGDDRLHRAIVDDTGVGANFTGFGAIVPEQLPSVLSTLSGQSGLRVEQRWDLRAGAVDLSNVDEVSEAIAATSATTTETAPFGEPTVRIRLGPVLDAEAAARSATRNAVLVASVGAAAVAIALFVQLQRAAADRRRPWWQQSRSRGATSLSLVSASTSATIAVVALGVAIGALVTRPFADSAATTWPGTVTAFAVALVVSDMVCQLVELRRIGRTSGGRPSRWARAAAVLLVLLAVASVSAVRRGGVDVTEGVDLLAVFPIVLVPLAITVAVVALVERLLRRRTLGRVDVGVGRLIGIRRAAAMRNAPTVVAGLVLATSVGVTSVIVGSSLLDGERADTAIPDAPSTLADAGVVVFLVAGAVAIVLGALGVAVAMVITMRRRRVDAALLNALGAPTVEYRQSVLAESLPMIWLATVVGGLSGFVTAALLVDRLDLGAFGVDEMAPVGVRLFSTVIVMLATLVTTTCVVRWAASRGRARQDGAR